MIIKKNCNFITKFTELIPDMLKMELNFICKKVKYILTGEIVVFLLLIILRFKSIKIDIMTTHLQNNISRMTVNIKEKVI